MILKLFYISSLIGQGLSFGKIYLFHLLLIPAFIVTFSFSKIKRFISENPFIIILALYPAATLIWSPSINYGVQDVLHILFGILILYLISVSKLNSKMLINIISFVFWLNIGISVCEAFDLFTYPLSMFSPWATSLGKVYAGKWGRTIPTGFYYNPNNNAFFVLFLAPIVMSTLSAGMSVFLILVSTFVIFMATSKVILVGWIILLFYLLFKLAKEKIGILKTSLLLVIITVLVTFLFKVSDSKRLEKYSKTIPSLVSFTLEAPVNIFNRVIGNDVYFDYKSIDMSLHERLMFLDGIAKILHKDWAWGSGAGSLHEMDVEQAGHVKNMKTPHFYLAELAGKYGVFYLGIYLYWLFTLFRASLRVNKLYGVSLILFLVFNAVMSSATYFLPKWALYALLMKLKEEKKENQ